MNKCRQCRRRISDVGPKWCTSACKADYWMNWPATWLPAFDLMEYMKPVGTRFKGISET